MSIFRTEKDKEEFMRVFRKITMSGDINDDRAIEIIMRDHPHFFHQPTADEIKKSFHAAMNDEIRARAQQTNLPTASFEDLPTNKTPS
jgi:hypothetical protein